MKRFNYRLQRVLDIKNTIEEVKRRDFLTAQSKLIDEENELKKIFEIRENYQKDLSEQEKREIDLKIIQLYYNFFNSLELRMKYQNNMINLAKEEMEKRREILVEAVKETKVLEKLKEKKLEEYNYEAGKEEQSINDEISGGQFFKEDKFSLSQI
ncbi:flagellar export protein FliJ [candidate division KSB1 bacterium]